MVETLERLVAGCEARRESLVVEGVHLSLNFVVRLMQRHPSIIPFLIFISNEAKHRERFAARPCIRGPPSVCAHRHAALAHKNTPCGLVFFLS